MQKILEISYDGRDFDVTINGPEVAKMKLNPNTEAALAGALKNATQNLLDLIVDRRYEQNVHHRITKRRENTR